MDYRLIANKIEDMIKDSIVRNGLVKTGKLLKSIKVTSDGKGDYIISAEDYFTYLDAEYDILKTIFDSKEFDEYVTMVYEQEIQKELNNL